MTETNERRHKIAIIGAGISGLRCADVLLQHGYHVTIFEARDRLGGRVAQSKHLGHTVDLGPNWIHGSSENPILRIARDTGTALHAWTEEEAIFDPDGRRLDASEAEEYNRLLWDDGLIAQAFAYSAQHTVSIDPQRSLFDFFEEKAGGLFTDLPFAQAERKRQTLLQVSQMWGAYVGMALQRQSLKFFWLEQTIEGENPFVSGTYAGILEAVARPAREGGVVRLGVEVVRVSSGGEGTGEGVVIGTAEGEEEKFDEVVVTIPLGCLKRDHRTLFDPPLPPRITAAIENLGYGNLDKVYITFPSAFWSDPPSPTHPTKTSHCPTTPNNAAFPSSIHYLTPTTDPSRDIVALNLAALTPPQAAHPTLLIYISGALATHIATLAAVSPNNPAILEYFTPYIALLPNYSPTDPACTPSGVLATAWANDKFAGYGSYSNFPVGLEAGDEDIRVLREGLGMERGVWFAGEHAAPVEALGTTTGAHLSGERVAERIVGRWKEKGRTG